MFVFNQTSGSELQPRNLELAHMQLKRCDDYHEYLYITMELVNSPTKATLLHWYVYSLDNGLYKIITKSIKLVHMHCSSITICSTDSGYQRYCWYWLVSNYQYQLNQYSNYCNLHTEIKLCIAFLLFMIYFPNLKQHFLKI